MAVKLTLGFGVLALLGGCSDLETDSWDRGVLEVSVRDGSCEASHGNQVFWGGHFLQAYGIYDQYDGAARAGLFWIQSKERVPGVEGEYSRVLTVAAPFEMMRVAPRCADDYFVLGYYEESDTYVLERWQIRAPLGAWSAPRAESSQPMGVSIPGHRPAAEEIVGGGPFVAPADRIGSREVIRTLIYAAPPGQAVVHLECDPDGRFALYSDGSVIRRIVIGDSNPTVLAGSTDLSLGVHSITFFDSYQSQKLGRYLVIRAGAYDYQALLVDSANDGEFEAVLEMDRSEYIQEYGVKNFSDLVF